MSTRKIAVVVGSFREDSINRMLARAVIKLMPNELECRLLRIEDLPDYDQDLDLTPPEPVARLKSEIAAANGLLFVTPDDTRSIPTVLAKVLDWASRPHGKNAWAGKPAAVVGASGSAAGTIVSQHHLRNMLADLDVPTLGRPEVFIHFTAGLIDPDGNIANDDIRKFLQGFVDRYVAFVARYA